MIVAAGLGTRLRPLSDLRPKPAVPVRGLPLVAYPLTLLAHAGVTQVTLNVHHHPDVLIEAARTWCPESLDLRFSHEPDLLDTGGGIARVAGFLRESDPCLLLGGDMIVDLDVGELVAAHRRSGRTVTAVLRRDDRAERFGTIGVDRLGRMRRIGRRFDLGGDTDAGVYTWVNVVSAAALDSLPDREEFSHLDHWWAPELARGSDRRRGAGVERVPLGAGRHPRRVSPCELRAPCTLLPGRGCPRTRDGYASRARSRDWRRC
jgi:NDP-sugar pyrophosphorylase family protein